MKAHFMKAYLKKHRVDFLLISLFGIGATLAYALHWDFGRQAAANFADSLVEMVSFIPAIFILIGLLDAWVPKEVIAKHTGEGSGWKSALWMILLAMLQAGPLYGAFPVAYLMWKKGTAVRNIFIYLGAFTTLKIPMLGFEIGFLGLKFTLLRTVLSVPVFILIAVIMERFFGKHFVMSDGASAPAPAKPTTKETSS